MESQNPLTEKGTNMSASGDSTNSRLPFSLALLLIYALTSLFMPLIIIGKKYE